MVVDTHKLGDAHQRWTISGDTIASGKDKGKVLDISGESRSRGAKICVWEKHGKDNQKWEFQHLYVDKTSP